MVGRWTPGAPNRARLDRVPTLEDSNARNYDKTPRRLSPRPMPEQFRGLQNAGTERPFENDFLGQQEPGPYVDCGARFAPFDKFDRVQRWFGFTTAC